MPIFNLKYIAHEAVSSKRICQIFNGLFVLFALVPSELDSVKIYKVHVLAGCLGHLLFYVVYAEGVWNEFDDAAV